ncbi:sulfotransferase [Fulvivirga sp. M361]|uniref:sulfotransferase domain-containing protein n=1 Tax=Fulvivirga sp. M361 TaxID=2594266 RepID=UPI00117A0CCA|nr:sulfotransferase domain-containing protein [Fulvivirga sp. M361]TRX50218.1 sulfotransferase [Fulvivirga sp. M361]
MKSDRIKFVITGSQRSGTTLLNLLLNAHSKIEVIDEDQVGFHGERVQVFFDDSQASVVGFKLPMISNEIVTLKKIGAHFILFLMRHPLDVINSMIRLRIKFDHTQPSMRWNELYSNLLMYIGSPKKFLLFFLIKMRLFRNFNLPWYLHPDCIDPEIRNSILSNSTDDKTEGALQVHPLFRERQQFLPIAAKVWYHKNNVLPEYKKQNLSFIPLKYEELLDDPEHFLQSICRYLGISYEENMLLFYQHGKGKSIGNTSNSEDIKKNNHTKWKGNFSNSELKMIKKEVGTTAEKFGYVI